MSLMKKAIGGSIHRIREFELEKVNLIDEFDILQIVGEGWFGKILLTEHRSTQTEMVLKALPKAYTGISDFFREFHYGLHLSAHRNIITTYDVAFETAGFYIFSQEYAPLGDLTSNVTETGLGELHAKRVARQLAAAIHHIHSRELVHRDIKLDNILVFRSDFSRIKLCDFGETRRVNTVVRRHNEWLPYSPPEVLQIDTDVTYKAVTAHDVWQFGIVLFVCLTGCLPWQKAALDDPRYTRYLNWHTATLNIAKKPKLFQLISSKAQRMFKRLLDPKGEKRPSSVLEVNKYLEDRWLAKLGAEKALNGGADERDELCPSMYSFHSSLEEKNQLLYTLMTYGIETTVDRSKKKDRIREWIESSAIAEENEEEESDLNEQDKLEACLEDGDEEPVSMKGRHFPERRPSAPIEDTERRRKKRHSSHPRKRQPKAARSLETKSPFAPQVAEERETIARFASFPNGDPSLAIAPNPTDDPAGSQQNLLERSRSLDSPVKTTKLEEVGQSLRNSPGSSTNTSQDSFVNVAARNNNNNNAAGSSANGRKQEDEARNDRSFVESPAVPGRKNRSQTLPPSGSASPRGVRAEVIASQPLIKPEVRPDETAPRADSSGTADAAENQYKVNGVRTENGITGRTNGQSPPRTEIPAAASGIVQGPSNTLTSMPVTSHLVLQSFNALQDVNSVMISSPESGSPSNSLTNISSNSVRNSPAKSTTATKPNRRYDRYDDAPIMSYGKDAFEHYGIAQGVIFRTESIKHRGHVNGNASRSVSN